MGIVMVGVSILFIERLSPEGFLGNVLAVLSGLSFAWMTLFLRKQKRGSPVESVFLGNLLAAVIGLPFFLKKKTNEAPMAVNPHVKSVA